MNIPYTTYLFILTFCTISSISCVLSIQNIKYPLKM